MTSPTHCSHCGALFSPTSRICPFCEIGINPVAAFEDAPTVPGRLVGIEDAPTQLDAVAVTEFKRVHLEREARRQKAGNLTRSDDRARQRYRAGSTAMDRSDDDMTAEEQAAEDTLFGILGAAFFMAMADGEMSDEEYDALVTFLIEFSDGELSEEIVDDGLEDWAGYWEHAGRDACFEQLQNCLVERDERLAALQAAAAVALADGDPSPQEHRVFDDIAKVLEIDGRQAQEAFSSVERMFVQ